MRIFFHLSYFGGFCLRATIQNDRFTHRHDASEHTRKKCDEISDGGGKSFEKWPQFSYLNLDILKIGFQASHLANLLAYALGRIVFYELNEINYVKINGTWQLYGVGSINQMCRGKKR